jgi:hypothetical protein
MSIIIKTIKWSSSLQRPEISHGSRPAHRSHAPRAETRAGQDRTSACTASHGSLRTAVAPAGSPAHTIPGPPTWRATWSACRVRRAFPKHVRAQRNWPSFRLPNARASCGFSSTGPSTSRPTSDRWRTSWSRGASAGGRRWARRCSTARSTGSSRSTRSPRTITGQRTPARRRR